jgi:glutamate dehydrogenase/leucine dehydrogenase
MKVDRDIEIGGERFALLVATQHGSITARTAVHAQGFRRRIGGARFVRQGDVAEVGHLASGMTWKCAAAGLPADGEKSVITCPDGIPEGIDERAAILGEHARQVREVDPGVIFGPDMNNGEDVMSRASEADDLRDHITGLDPEHGGLSIDARGYTAFGLFAAARAARKLRSEPLHTASIQGFGAVGAHAAKLLYEAGVAIRAASAREGALIADDGALPLPEMFAAWNERGNDAFADYADETPDGARFDPDPDALLSAPADIFVPAARTGVLAMPAELERVRELENPNCESAVRFLEETGVRMVAQGANYPVTPAAEEYLEENGVIVLPDYIVNCGGLVGCYFEWAYRDELLQSAAKREEMHSATLRVIERIVERNVEALFSSEGRIRERARRLAEGHRKRLLARCAEFPAEATSHDIARACLEELVSS